MSEHDEQCALMQWARLNDGRLPELRLLFAIPNGARVGHQTDQAGRTYSIEGQWLAAEGLRRGVPDLFLPAARLGYNGLFIEMKSAAGRVSTEQAAWKESLEDAGYWVQVCRGWEAARDIIEWYLEGGD